jgi:hypothetical protein
LSMVVLFIPNSPRAEYVPGIPKERPPSPESPRIQIL